MFCEGKIFNDLTKIENTVLLGTVAVEIIGNAEHINVDFLGPDQLSDQGMRLIHSVVRGVGDATECAFACTCMYACACACVGARVSSCSCEFYGSILPLRGDLNTEILSQQGHDVIDQGINSET